MILLNILYNICALKHMFVYGYATAMFRGKKKRKSNRSLQLQLSGPCDGLMWAILRCSQRVDHGACPNVEYERFSWMIIYCWWWIHINLGWLWLIYELLIYVNDPQGCKYSVCIRDVVGKRQGIWLCNVACCEFCEFVKRSVITFIAHMYPPEV